MRLLCAMFLTTATEVVLLREIRWKLGSTARFSATALVLFCLNQVEMKFPCIFLIIHPLRNY
jgi:hypothetical protein